MVYCAPIIYEKQMLSCERVTELQQYCVNHFQPYLTQKNVMALMLVLFTVSATIFCFYLKLFKKRKGDSVVP